MEICRYTTCYFKCKMCIKLPATCVTWSLKKLFSCQLIATCSSRFYCYTQEDLWNDEKVLRAHHLFSLIVLVTQIANTFWSKSIRHHSDEADPTVFVICVKLEYVTRLGINDVKNSLSIFEAKPLYMPVLIYFPFLLLYYMAQLLQIRFKMQMHKSYL